MAQPPEVRLGVRTGTAGLKLAHGGLHALCAVADKELSKGGRQASLLIGRRGGQPGFREFSGVWRESDPGSQ